MATHSVKAGAAALAPPRKLSEVKPWLASHARDRRAFAVLAKASGRNSPTHAACVRALAAIGGDRALDALASYRVEEFEGQYGNTFQDAVAREIAAAWPRFDRAEFARRLFPESLWFDNAGEVESLEGIEAVRGLSDLTVMVRAGCSVEPLARCKRLRYLSVRGRIDVAPLARIRSLIKLSVGDDEIPSLDALRGCPVRRLEIQLGPAVPFDFLERLPKLERVKFATSREKLNASDLDVLAKLVRRGVELCGYGHQAWTRAFRRVGGKLTEAAGFRAVGAQDFTEVLQLNTFF